MGKQGLWGEEFENEESRKNKTQEVLNKITLSSSSNSPNADKVLKSKKVALNEKMSLVESEVYRILGKQLENVKTIYDKSELHEYLQKGIDFGSIAIDTETNNSLDPITCKLMGLCLYIKGEKQVYVPINHINKDTKERLSNQLTEQDIHDELQWLIDNKGDCQFIFHNGKFDYEVLKCTCNVEMPIDFDTMIGMHLINENENSFSLKKLYISKIDQSQEKYDIENLFEHLPYEIFKPELFALYAATDSMMTYKLYEWEMEYLNKKENKDVLNLARTLEMPVIKVFAEMELNGVSFDIEYSQRLKEKYQKKLEEIDKEINLELSSIKPLIEEWRTTQDANKKQINSSGKEGKSKSEQLSDPINLASPTQLAILLYDVIKVEPVLKNVPRGTGVEVLEKLELPLAKLILKRREITKLLTAFIDALPKEVNIDGKIHCHFNQYGAQTGRTSCIAKGTKISMPSGDKPIEEVKVGDFVYCYDINTNRLTLRKVLNVFNNGKRHCVKLHWKSRYNPQLTGELICTPDHFLRTVNRGWVEACEVKPADSLLYVHKRKDTNCISLSANFGQGGSREEHIRIKENYFNKVGNKWHIHHIDHNRFNNSLNNLVVVTPKEHNNIHRADSCEDGSVYGGGYGFTREQVVKMCEDANWELLDTGYDLESVKKRLENYKINYILKYTESYSHRKFRKSSSGGYMKNLHLPLVKHNLIYALELSKGDVAEAASYFAVSIDEFVKACDKYEILSNHNVVSIEYLDDLYEVYDLEVEEHHNFIAGELCVHNCSNPNLQQIPSHEKAIRMLFKASSGNVLVGSDYSQQEVKILSAFSQDEDMINAYKNGKDLYAIIASGVYHNKYEDNLEHYPDGSKNVEGAKRRSNCKSILLGLLYGRGAASIAEQIGESYEDAQAIIDNFYKSFPKVKRWMDNSLVFAKKYGYVTDMMGRRRRLPDIQLPRFEIKSDKKSLLVNPFLICKNREFKDNKIKNYEEKLASVKTKREIEKIIQSAAKEKIIIKDNSGFISQAERQCINSRIQGSAASMTKKAMLEIFKDKELNDLGFKLLINVHD